MYASLRSCPSYREYARVDKVDRVDRVDKVDKTTGEERPNQFLRGDEDNLRQGEILEKLEEENEEDAGKLLDHWLGELNSLGQVKICNTTKSLFSLRIRRLRVETKERIKNKAVKVLADRRDRITGGL